LKLSLEVVAGSGLHAPEQFPVGNEGKGNPATPEGEKARPGEESWKIGAY